MPAGACDLCAVYTATSLRKSEQGPWIGVAEQFTHFHTLQLDGHEVPNEAGERVDSSITQILLGYNVTLRVGLQLAVPIITRQYRRLEGGEIARGHESGVGDARVLVRYNAFERILEEGILRLDLLGGLKLATGSAARLAEELDEHAATAAEGGGPAAGSGHTGVASGRHRAVASSDRISRHDDDLAGASGVHGHDLALGTGSLDFLFGASGVWTWERLFVDARVDYAVRTEGKFDYRFANDLTWAAGPGAFALLDDRHTLAVSLLVSGETKGNDEQAGVTIEDTAITALYLGPRLAFTQGSKFSADLSLELPVIQNTSSLQIVADYRLRGGLVWRF